MMMYPQIQYQQLPQFYYQNNQVNYNNNSFNSEIIHQQYYPVFQNNFNDQQYQEFFQQEQIQFEQQSVESFEEFNFDVSQLNVFGCLNESIDLLDIQSKQIDQENYEEVCDDESTNNGSSNCSSNILEEEFSEYIQINKIDLFSGQGVHLFFAEEECQQQEEIFLYDDEQIIVVQNMSQVKNLKQKSRVIQIFPGQEVVIRRALSQHSDSEMIATISLSNKFVPLCFNASSEFSE